MPAAEQPAFLPREYHVRPMGTACHATGESFPPGAAVRSVLVLEDGRQLRRDYAADAFDPATVPPGTLGHWAATAPVPDEQPAKEELTAEEAVRLLDTFDPASVNDEQKRMRYALALLLLDEGAAEIGEVREEAGVRTLVLSGTGGEGPWEVEDLGLKEEEVAGLIAGGRR